MNKLEKRITPEHVTLTARLTREAISQSDFSIVLEREDLTKKQKLYLAQSILIRLMVTCGYLKFVNQLWENPKSAELVQNLESKTSSTTNAKILMALFSLEQASQAGENSFIRDVFAYADENVDNGNQIPAKTEEHQSVMRISGGATTIINLIENNMIKTGLADPMDVAQRLMDDIISSASYGISQAQITDEAVICPISGKIIPSKSEALITQERERIKNNTPLNPQLKSPQEILNIGDGVCPAVSAGVIGLLIRQAADDITKA